MTGRDDALALRIPPAIRNRLDGIEAELRPTPARPPVRAPSSDGRPTLYLVDGRVATRIRPRPVRRTRRMNPGWLAVAGVASLIATVGLAGLLGVEGGSGPGASATSPASAASAAAPASPARTAAASAMASAAASVAPPMTASPSDLGPPLGPLPTLAGIQVIRGVADPATTATQFLRSKCIVKEPGLDPVAMKKLLTTAFAAKIDAGWVDQSRTMFVAQDVIDAAQAFGATVLIEGPAETWAIARDGTTTVALHLESVPALNDRQAWWSSLLLRPTACT